MGLPRQPINTSSQHWLGLEWHPRVNEWAKLIIRICCIRLVEFQFDGNGDFGEVTSVEFGAREVEIANANKGGKMKSLRNSPLSSLINTQ